MYSTQLLLNISSKYIIDIIISHLESNIYYKIIKYNKKFHQKMNINLEESLINYLYNIQTKDDIMNKMNKTNNQLKYTKSYQYYSQNFSSFKEDFTDESDIFLTKYKEYKINAFPLPSDFNKVNLEEKLLILENNIYSFKYTLNDENIELIYLINEFRVNNNLNKLICNKIENLIDFFREKNSNKNRYLFKKTFNEFKTKLLTKDEKITKILLIEELKYIKILEKEKNEYILIYSDNNQKSFLQIDKKALKSDKFFLLNNTISIVDTKKLTGFLKKYLISYFSSCFKDEGFQIFSFKNDTLIGVLEGPPKTPFENGYFLFKIILSNHYPFLPPKFIFISNIFHPNISEDGFVSIDIFNDKWSPSLCIFSYVIYSVQSLLDDPNPDNFLNEKAAKLYKENRNNYEKIVKEYTSTFASYSKFLDEIKKMNLDIMTIKDGEKFKCIYSEE